MSITIPVVVLAGGLGTRLRSSVPDLPKVLAPIVGKAFIDILLSWLEKQGVERVVFSLGYKAKMVKEHLDKVREKHAINISYVIEHEPVGTLGGLSLALTKLSESNAIVVNGDSWVDVNLADFVRLTKDEELSLVRHYVDDVSRYGSLELDSNDFILSFREKQNKLTEGNTKYGWINAGVYFINERVISDILSFSEGSLEEKILANSRYPIKSFSSTGKGFIDIGTPESYSLAPEVLKEYLL